MKKIYFLLAIVLVASLIAGCGTNDDSAETVDVKRVGDAEFGFLTIPEDWNNFSDIGMTNSGIPHIGFRSLTGSIINLISYEGILEDVDIDQFMQQMGVEYEMVKIDGNDAFRTHVYFEGYDMHLYGWYFVDSDAIFRLITAEGFADEILQVKAIVENTFSMTY